MAVVSATIPKRIRNDLANEAKKEGRAFANYLAKIISDHHSQLNIKGSKEK